MNQNDYPDYRSRDQEMWEYEKAQQVKYCWYCDIVKQKKVVAYKEKGDHDYCKKCYQSYTK